MTDTMDARVADIKARARALIASLEELSDQFQQKTLPDNLKNVVASAVKGQSAIAQSFLALEFPGGIDATPANEAALSVAEATVAQLEAGVEPLRKQIETLW